VTPFSDSVRCLAVVGAQWGDEGKGKLSDILAARASVVVRFQGGANAGHTVRVGDDEFILHLIPSGILTDGVRSLLGCGVVVDPWALQREAHGLTARGIAVTGRMGISRRAHLVLPHHREMDVAQEVGRGDNRIGTTSRGIGPAYRDKVAREGLRLGDLHDWGRTCRIVEAGARRARFAVEAVGVDPGDRAGLDAALTLERLGDLRQWLLGMATSTGDEIRSALAAGKRVLLEGAQGALLDVDHGTYPFVTSSTTTAGAAAAGSGIGPTLIDEVLGVVKAYVTRVGEGPFPTELSGREAEKLRRIGREFGATTGRPRRPGWFDAVAMRHAAAVNGLTGVAVTKLDVLDSLEEIKVASCYRLDGKEIDRFPDSAADLDRAEPVYETWPGWREPTTECRTFDELPARAQAYLRRIEEVASAPLRYVSVGPDRAHTVPI